MELADKIGQILWYSIPFTPLITIPITWRLIKKKWYIRIIIGLLIAGGLSILLYGLSLAIIFRDGMGPT
jgi:hypothetical protein